MNRYSKMAFTRLTSIHVENRLSDCRPDFEGRHAADIESVGVHRFDDGLMGLHGVFDGFASRVATVLQLGVADDFVEVVDHLAVVVADPDADRRFGFDHTEASILQGDNHA